MGEEYPIPTGETEDGLKVVKWTDPSDIAAQFKRAANGESEHEPNPVKSISIKDRILLGNAVIAAEERAKKNPEYRMKDLSHVSGIDGVMAMRSQTGQQYKSIRDEAWHSNREILNSANWTLGDAGVGIQA